MTVHDISERLHDERRRREGRRRQASTAYGMLFPPGSGRAATSKPRPKTSAALWRKAGPTAPKSTANHKFGPRVQMQALARPPADDG